MKCIKCGIRVKTPRGETRETQICGACRGAKGRPSLSKSRGKK